MEEVVTQKTTLSEGEMLLLKMGYTIDREERPRSMEDLVGQKWRHCEDGWVLVDEKEDTT